MRILFDTNVILDLLLEREPFAKEAELLVNMVEKGEVEGVLCATTITTIHYLISKSLGKEKSIEVIESLFKLFEIAGVTRAVLIDALEVKDKDFEDAVLYKSAFHFGVTMIVTRDRSDFDKADIPVMSPHETLAMLASMKQ